MQQPHVGARTTNAYIKVARSEGDDRSESVQFQRSTAGTVQGRKRQGLDSVQVRQNAPICILCSASKRWYSNPCSRRKTWTIWRSYSSRKPSCSSKHSLRGQRSRPIGFVATAAVAALLVVEAPKVDGQAVETLSRGPEGNSG